ncbi:TlpA family protein disulfide reductase [Macrococcoides caseolyticum]|uniref:TlpA family protein disulfide reductase n=1 Tax=Macrococcoides caseolyticum TaxID=69966 RepID=UPI001F28C85A|nr:TlpA disulfide reductase family protein [Macrococcus caseolyticus]MCE4955842.1 TlpA family protein disulfide reductase [Macrococcus caseolyticus]
MKHIITIFLLIIFLGLVGYSIYQVSQFNATDNVKSVTTHEHPINGQNLSHLKVSNLDGNKVNLRRYLNHEITIINFWASWCEPCNKEMPELVQYHQNKPNHVGLVGINVQDKPDKRLGFIEKYQAKYPMIIFTEEQMKKYKIINIPTTLFIDKKGKVLKTYVGELDQHKIELIISDLK